MREKSQRDVSEFEVGPTKKRFKKKEEEEVKNNFKITSLQKATKVADELYKGLPVIDTACEDEEKGEVEGKEGEERELEAVADKENGREDTVGDEDDIDSIDFEEPLPINST